MGKIVFFIIFDETKAEPKNYYFWGMSQKWHFYLTHVPDAESFKYEPELKD